MESKELSLLLRGADALVIIVWLCLLFIWVPFCPVTGGLKIALVVFMAVATVLVVVAALFAWKMFICIGRGESFTRANADRLKKIGMICLVDVVVLLVGVAVLHTADWSVLVALMLAAFACGGVAIVSAALSHLTLKAAVIQEENELTV